MRCSSITHSIALFAAVTYDTFMWLSCGHANRPNGFTRNITSNSLPTATLLGGGHDQVLECFHMFVSHYYCLESTK